MYDEPNHFWHDHDTHSHGSRRNDFIPNNFCTQCRPWRNKFGEFIIPWQFYQRERPGFYLADVVAGPPGVDKLLCGWPKIADPNRPLIGFEVSVKSGIGSGAANLLAKKMATLVMVLEPLLLKLVAPGRWPWVTRELTEYTYFPWFPDCSVKYGYDSHVPPMVATKPEVANGGEPEYMDTMLKMTWGAPSLCELDSRLLTSPQLYYGFSLSLSKEDWMYKDPRPCQSREYVFEDDYRQYSFHESRRQQNLEEGWSSFCFKHLQTTSDDVLLRNWVEVIIQIVELAMASPDEYKRCLEVIFRIQHDDDHDGTAWELLMRQVLKLEHRILYWTRQMDKYGRE